jgi:hypothetical protein
MSFLLVGSERLSAETRIVNLSEEGLRTSRNDRNHQKDVVILMVLLVNLRNK